MSVLKEISLTKVDYKIDCKQEEDKVKATIIPVVKIKVKKKQTLIADLKVDGLELLPSAKVCLKKGENKAELPRVIIFRRFSPEPDEALPRGTTYQMELRMSPDGVDYITDITSIDINW